MTVGHTYREILRSSSLIGAASVVGILIGVVRTKIAAVYLGPAGVGLLGLYSNLVATAANVASVGAGPAATRRLAEASASGDSQAVAMVRKGLDVTTAWMAVLGGVLVWVLREPLAKHVLSDPVLAPEIGWLGLGVGLSVAAISQSALLNGLRRIRDLAAMNVAGAAAGALLGIPILLLYGRDGLVTYFLVGLAATLVVGYFYTGRVGTQRQDATPARVWLECRSLVRLGSAFMLGGLAVTLGNLAVRAMVQKELGSAAVGHFEAAWTISMTYMGLVLRAMGTDYFPRLAGVLAEKQLAVRVVNEQTEVLLVLAMPLLITVSALAPLLVHLLYSREFQEAAVVLRLQVLGDIFKIMSWPLGMVLLAAGAGRAYLFAETFAVAVFVFATWASMGRLALNAAGFGFLMMYVAYLPLVVVLARRKLDFRFSRLVRRDFALLLGGCAGPLLLSQYLPVAGAAVGSSLAVVSGIYAVHRLRTAVRR